MNCHCHEIYKYLISCDDFSKDYNIDIISTYLNLNDIDLVIKKLKNYDVIVMHNIKQYNGITYEDVKNFTNKNTKIIKCEFLRFNGFLPDEYKNYDDLWYIPKNIEDMDYNTYYNKKIHENQISEKFNSALLKLKKLDEQSDIKYYDFFIDNYKNFRLFSDYTHPQTIFFKHISQQILKILGYENQLKILPESYEVSGIRKSIILKCVKDTLGLNYSENNINYVDINDVTQEELYIFYQYLIKNNIRVDILKQKELFLKFRK